MTPTATGRRRRPRLAGSLAFALALSTAGPLTATHPRLARAAAPPPLALSDAVMSP